MCLRVLRTLTCANAGECGEDAGPFPQVAGYLILLSLERECTASTDYRRCACGCYGLSHAPMLANAVKMLGPSHKRPLRSACFRNANTPKDSQRSRVPHSIAPINKPDNRESARPYCVSLIWTQCQNEGSDLLVNCISLIVNIWSSCYAIHPWYH